MPFSIVSVIFSFSLVLVIASLVLLVLSGTEGVQKGSREALLSIKLLGTSGALEVLGAAINLFSTSFVPENTSKISFNFLVLVFGAFIVLESMFFFKVISEDSSQD